MFEQKDEGLVFLNVGDLVCGIPFIIAIKVVGLNNGLMVILLLSLGVLQIFACEDEDDEQQYQYRFFSHI